MVNTRHVVSPPEYHTGRLGKNEDLRLPNTGTFNVTSVGPPRDQAEAPPSHGGRHCVCSGHVALSALW